MSLHRVDDAIPVALIRPRLATVAEGGESAIRALAARETGAGRASGEGPSRGSGAVPTEIVMTEIGYAEPVSRILSC